MAATIRRGQPLSMRNLTNDYKDCQLIKLDPSERGSPLIVAQEGCAPDDPRCRSLLFYLQRDGKWINEIARSTRPDTECGDIVFETAAEALRLLAGLSGRPIVRQIDVTEPDTEAYIAKAKSLSSLEQGYREFLVRYRAAQKRK
ncbi:MAG TPA: hypothetical protein VK961_04325 [Chthoniobacter sp.]|nr:hypothetical protein [Chthoniobacter sp.]